MKILKGRCEWMEGCGNHPSLYLLTEGMPKWEDLRYRLIPTRRDVRSGTQSIMAVAEMDGFVHYFSHNPMDQTGYGGDVFRVKDLEGKPHEFKGPWSSRAGVVNRMGLGFQVVDAAAAYQKSPTAFERGYTFVSCNVTLDLLRQSLGVVDHRGSYCQMPYGKKRGDAGTVTTVFPEGSRTVLLRHDESAESANIYSSLSGEQSTGGLSKGDVRYDLGVKFPDGTVWTKDCYHKLAWRRVHELRRYDETRYGGLDAGPYYTSVLTETEELPITPG